MRKMEAGIVDLRVAPRLRVVWIWVMTVLAVVVVALAWYFMEQAVHNIYNLMAWMYPSKITDNSIVFPMSVWDRLPLLALFGIAVWVFVKSQKRPEY